MYCNHCGALNPGSSTTCSKCGQPLAAAAGGTATPLLPGEKVPTHLIPAIITTLCCCLPSGIVAIVYAAQVDGKVAAGDLAGARRASGNAKMWCWISLAAGIVVIGLYVIMGLVPLLTNPELQKQIREEMQKQQQQIEQRQIEERQK